MDPKHPYRHGQSSPEADDPRQTDEIDENLKRVYSALLEQEVPERFQSLIEQLRRKDAGSGK